MIVEASQEIPKKDHKKALQQEVLDQVLQGSTIYASRIECHLSHQDGEQSKGKNKMTKEMQEEFHRDTQEEWHHNNRKAIQEILEQRRGKTSSHSEVQLGYGEGLRGGELSHQQVEQLVDEIIRCMRNQNSYVALSLDNQPGIRGVAYADKMDKERYEYAKSYLSANNYFGLSRVGRLVAINHIEDYCLDEIYHKG